MTRHTSEKRAQFARQALNRAAAGITMSNYPAIFEGFAARGIPIDQIRPRENVFTYAAWHALGRQVRNGEHGIKVVTVIQAARKERDDATGQEIEKIGSRPWTATVFHVSQTDPIPEVVS